MSPKEAIRESSPPGPVLSQRFLAGNVLLNLAGYGLPLVVALFTLPYLIHRLGTDRFGILSLAWVLVGYLGFMDFGLGRASTKFVAEALGRGREEDIPGYLWTAVLFQVLAGAAGAVIVVLVSPVLIRDILRIPAALHAESELVLKILALSVPLVLVSASFRGVLEAQQKFRAVNAVKIPSSVANYLIPAAALFAGAGLVEIIAVLVAARGATLGFWIGISRRSLPVLRTRPVFHRGKAVKLLKFGGWTTVTSVVGPVLDYADRFFIGSLLTIGAVSFYAAPGEAVAKLGIIPVSITGTLFPAFSALNGRMDRESLSSLFVRAAKYTVLAVGTIVSGMTFGAPIILRLWLGAEFAAKSSVVFQFLAIGFLGTSLGLVAFSLLQGMGRADIPAKFYLLEAVIYLPALWLGLKSGGLNGAAAVWMLRAVGDAALLMNASVRSGALSWRRFWRDGLGWAIVVFGLLASAGFLVRLSPWLILAWPCLFGAAVGLSRRRIFSDEEWGWGIRLVRRIAGRAETWKFRRAA